jgi:hypothetical protein
MYHNRTKWHRDVLGKQLVPINRSEERVPANWIGVGLAGPQASLWIALKQLRELHR